MGPAPQASRITITYMNKAVRPEPVRKKTKTKPNHEIIIINNNDDKTPILIRRLPPLSSSSLTKALGAS